MTAQIPSFGIVGTAGVESQERGGGVDLLELPDGTGVQLYRRMARPNLSENRVTLTAWGVTPVTTPFAIYPESVTLSAQEEAVQHEVARIATPTTSENATKYDAMLIFRARCSFSVSGRCNTATSFDDPFAIAWPTSYTSAIGAVTLSQSLITGTGTHGTLILSNATVNKIAADWHRFNYEYTWVYAGPGTGTAHVLNLPAGVTGPTETTVPGNTRRIQYSLAESQFATIAASFDVFPRS